MAALFVFQAALCLDLLKRVQRSRRRFKKIRVV